MKLPDKASNRNNSPTHRGVLLRALRDIEPASRTDLVRRTGLQASTVSTSVNELLREGVLEEVDSREASPRGGRRQILLAVAGDRPAAAGLHIGVHLISTTIIDARGRALRAAATRRPPGATPAEVVESAAESVRQLLAEFPHADRRMLGLGVTVPASVDRATGVVLADRGLEWHEEVELGRMLADRLGLAVSVDSSPYGQLLAERSFGSLKGVDDALLATVATTVRIAILKGGRLHSPSAHFAGDIGHFPTGSHARECFCGAIGCLNAIAGNDAVSERVSRLHGRKIDIREVDELAIAGDPIALKALRDAGRKISEALVPSLLIYEPQRVIIACPLASSASTLATELEKCVRRHSARLNGQIPEVAKPEFTGNMAIGAAWLPIEQALYS